MLFQISTGKTCPSYDAFYLDKKLKSGEEYDLPQEGVRLQLREHNPALGKFWFFRILLAFLGGLLSGKFEDFSSLRRTQRQIDVQIDDIAQDEFCLVCDEQGIHAEGARLTVLEEREVPLPQIERRVRAYKAGILALSLLAAAAVLAVLLFALL